MPDLSNIDSQTVAWPIRKDGSFGRWQVSPAKFMELVNLGYAKLGTWDKKRKTWTVLYLNRGSRKRMDDGEIVIVGKDEKTGAVIVEFARQEARLKNVKTVWHRKLHDSGVYGSTLLSTIIGRGTKFDFPKSIYSTKDAIKSVLRYKKNAIVLDFFAGSGTTLNAINLMNVEDNGNRTCILVTNNECSDDDAKELTRKGFLPNDKEWEEKGVCQSITWPRTKYTILGKRDDGSILEGNYYTDLLENKEKERTIVQIDFAPAFCEMSLGHKKKLVSLISGQKLPQSVVKKNSRFAFSSNEKHSATFLFDESAFEEWFDKIREINTLTDFYIVTKDNSKFNEMKNRIDEVFGNIEVQQVKTIAMSNGFQANVKYFKCGWTPRKPDDYPLSNALCLHIKELIELHTASEIDGVKNVLILGRKDYNRIFGEPDVVKEIKNVWVNENIIFNDAEMKILREKNFKYIPREFFGQELKEVGEYV